MLVLLLSACSEPKTENGNADDSKAARVTITFTMNGGTPLVPQQAISKNDKATKPSAAPTRSGSVFGGWYTNDKFITQFNFKTAITENTILYAKWNAAPPADTSLRKIITKGIIPQNLSLYNEMVQAVLAPYKSLASVVTLYVTITGKGTRDGSAWEHAKVGTDLHTTLQGIDDAKADKVYLLLIGSGEYTVSDTLAMKNHVAIVGGWDSNEDWARTADTPTILSGGGKQRVFKNNDIDNTALLYGVEITKGYDWFGAGMHNENSSPVLMNVTFSGNTALGGGGMHNSDDSSPVLTNVTFSENTAKTNGGGMYNWKAFPVLTNVTFSGNTAKNGGGMFNSGSASPVLTNVTFSENTAKTNGGGMYNLNFSSPTIVNTVFWGNTAPTGPQIYADNGGTITFAYSVIEKGATSNGITFPKNPMWAGELPTVVVVALQYTDPSLTALANNGGFVSTHAILLGDSSAANIGLYVRRQNKTFYYSTDKITWYTGFDSDGLTGTINLPSNAIDLTATDATGHERTGRPDAGAYEAR